MALLTSTIGLWQVPGIYLSYFLPDYLFIYQISYLTTYLSILFLPDYLSNLFFLTTSLSILFSTWLSILFSTWLPINLSYFYLNIYLSFLLSTGHLYISLISFPTWLSLCLSYFITDYLSIYLIVYLTTYLFIYLIFYLTIYLSILFSTRLFIYLSYFITAYLSFYITILVVSQAADIIEIKKSKEVLKQKLKKSHFLVLCNYYAFYNLSITSVFM